MSEWPSGFNDGEILSPWLAQLPTDSPSLEDGHGELGLLPLELDRAYANPHKIQHLDGVHVENYESGINAWELKQDTFCYSTKD